MTGIDRFGALAALVGALAPIGLGGCSDSARQAIGLDKPPPDEFAVVTRAPLALPPDYRLRPPAPGTARPQELETKDEARKTLIQSARAAEIPDDGTVSGAENALLGRAGAAAADSSIRSKVDVESTAIAQSQTGFVDKVIFWRKKEPPGEVLEATQEAQRLRANSALGSLPVKGATPLIERREKGFLEGLFN